MRSSAPPIPAMTSRSLLYTGDDGAQPRDTVRAPQVRRQGQSPRAALWRAAAARFVRRAQPPALRGGAAHGVGVGAGAAQRRVCGVAEVAPGSKEMAKTSAGLLMFHVRNGEPEVLLVHPGGPFWLSKDEGAWSIPKGEFPAGEEPLGAAQREFQEETGCR